MIKELQPWLSFATESEVIQIFWICFPEFKISRIPRAQNGIVDSLANTTRSFRKDFYFIGCSIMVWLFRTLQI